MNLREEMLEIAGLNDSRKSIERLMSNGAYFDKSYDHDLRVAVQEGVITSSYANVLRHSVGSGEIINKFFDTYVPLVEKALDRKIDYFENELENSSVIEESEKYNEELENLRNKKEKIRNILC